MPKVYKVKTSFNSDIELELIEKTRTTVIFKDKESGTIYKVVVKRANGDRFILNINGEDHNILIQSDSITIDSHQPLITSISTSISQEERKERREARQQAVVEPGVVVAPISGRVVEVKAKQGTVVNVGDTLVLLESMKMIIEVKAHISGLVEEVYVAQGLSVNRGDRLVKIKPS